MTIVPRLTLHGLPLPGFRLHSLPVKLRTGDAECPGLPEKSLKANLGSSLGGLRIQKRAGRGMTVQLNGMIMGGCLTEIARGNETRNYVNEPLLGSTNRHLTFAFPRLRLPQLHTGMVVITTPLTCPQQPRAWLTTCWSGVRTCRPGSTDRTPLVPCYKAREGQGDYQRDTPVDRFNQVEIES